MMPKYDPTPDHPSLTLQETVTTTAAAAEEWMPRSADDFLGAAADAAARRAPFKFTF